MGDCPVRQIVLGEKDFGWTAFWELKPELFAFGQGGIVAEPNTKPFAYSVAPELGAAATQRVVSGKTVIQSSVTIERPSSATMVTPPVSVRDPCHLI